jgi:LDH2 family malate/lactate/ureidoglycolate dehydrogenase
MSQSKVPVAAIRGLITDALSSAGLPREDAALCALRMGEADLTGADAHGIFRLPGYVRTIKRGHINAHPDIRVLERRHELAGARRSGKL